tara:strand:+ start:461 stop:2797 length:2337 start_codon:yes stop_codon:yes gene_type:complete
MKSIKFLFLILFNFYFISCVYFNTFYNAENSFKQANEIIDNSPYSFEQTEIPNAAKKLLNESILSCNIVLEEYSNSKYVDDANYYMARSYFTLSEYFKAKKYFNDLILKYPQSKYFTESKLWLEYTKLKLNSDDSILVDISNLEKELNVKDDQNLFFLLHNIKGDYNVNNKQFVDAFVEFEKALNFTTLNSQKNMIYSKLSYISENEKMYSYASKYLEQLELFSSTNESKNDAFRRWVEVKKKTKDYESLIFKIEEKLNSGIFETDKIRDEFKMELGIVYMLDQKYDESKNLFNDIINYSTQKQIKCESYYWLGYISLFKEFDLELSQEYFDLVLETMRTSDYSKVTKEYLNEIKSYKRIINEYESKIDSKIIDEKELETKYSSNEFLNKKIEKDSLLFIIGEKLYFDFNQPDLAILKHKELISLFPQSSYAVRSQNIIDYLEKNIYSLESAHQSIDTLSFLRDSAWKLFEYDKYAAVELFVNTAETYDDYLSYYSLGNIYENYLYQPQLGVEYFLKTFELVDDEAFKSVLKNKLLLIQESINDKVDSLIQKDYYKIGYNFLTEKSNLDSAQKYFNNSKKIKYSMELNQIINDYKNTLNIINYKEIKDSLNIINWSSKEFQRNEIDSMIMNLSEISFWYFKDVKTSESYLELIQINDSIKYYDKYIDLQKRIISKDFERDTSITKFNPHIQKSQKFNEFHNKISKMDNIYKDDLSKYNNLLNYITENLKYKEDVDSLKLENDNQTNMENIKNSLPIMKDVQMGIPIDIDININDDKSN